jgi:hypothetical protein
VEDLIPKARRLALQLGAVPSRNRLKSEFRIGAPKAGAVRKALLESGVDFDPSRQSEDRGTTGGQGTGNGSVSQGQARLHLVTDTESVPRVPESDPEPGLERASVPATNPNAGDDRNSSATPGHAAGSVVETQVMPVVGPVAEPASGPASEPVGRPIRTARRPVSVWPVLLLALPAFVAIWSGWVGLGGLTGFGAVHPLPGIWDSFRLNTAITLPIGMETYAAYALRVWLSGQVPARAARFAKWSAIGSLVLGALGQVAYHLMAAADYTAAPWWITTLVACLPVAVLGMGAALAHLIRENDGEGSR